MFSIFAIKSIQPKEKRMLTEKESQLMNRMSKDTMMEALGMKFLASNDEFVQVELPIGPATFQHTGIVHGGAYLTLAETAAGAGSLHVAGLNASVCGIQVSGNHVQMSPTQGKVIAYASAVSLGHSIHVWNVDIKDEHGLLLSSVRVVNRILTDQQGERKNEKLTHHI